MSRVQRYFLQIAYRGTNYHGWQVQEGQRSVQAAVENALSLLLQKKTEVTGCGRTDTGVHASMFYLHFDSETEPDAERFVYKLNGILDFDISVQQLLPVHENAHARFDAVSRTYRYFIHQQKNPFLNDISKFVAGHLDFEKMNEAAALLPEFSDFQSFAKTGTDVNNFNCKVYSAQWIAFNDQWFFEISANRFLRNMVRSLVGTILQVGAGKLSIEAFIEIVEARDRSRAGQSVDARGLFLYNVKYPYLP